MSAATEAPPAGLLDLPEALLVHIFAFLVPLTDEPSGELAPPVDLANTRLTCKVLREAVLAVPDKPDLAITAAKLQQAREAGLERQLLAFLARSAGRWRHVRLDGVDGYDLQQVVGSLVPAEGDGGSTSSSSDGASSGSGAGSSSDRKGVRSLELRSISPPWRVLLELSALPALSALRVWSYHNDSPIAASDLALLSSLTALQSLEVSAPISSDLSLPAEVLPSLQQLTFLELCVYSPDSEEEEVEVEEEEEEDTAVPKWYLSVCGEHMAACTALRSLELSAVQLLGQAPAALQRLEQLVLNRTTAEAGFWSALPQLPCLTSLALMQLSEEMFEALLSCLPACPYLDTLQLAGEHLWTLPQLPSSLTKLDFAGDVSLPVAPVALSLRSLQLFCCSSIEVWPEAMSGMVHLTSLHIHGCLSELPLPLAALPALENVQLHYNHLTDLPGQLAWLGSVRRLVLSDCRLKCVPAVLGGGAASRLEHLDLADNGELVLTEEQFDVLRSLTALRSLNIKDIGIGSWSGFEDLAEALRPALPCGCKIMSEISGHWT